MPTGLHAAGGQIALSVSLREGILQVDVTESQILTNTQSSEALLPIGDLLSLGHILSDCGYQFVWVKGLEEEGHPSCP